ncbi:Protein kinase-like (PK-like) [Venustampulla echinocandica]|uniref:EKC/KEOPS complex subunit BUD32 n=1 Tax=Venustampulla echinocandica TaxID=2656787 RepID=A0A370TUG7_9HELO|nr:Protein kinase-like (PK-like) [Venustampulla echinocandica]RDL39182.1 Protein kinase-like (PK-like) [Venustampulla echinocandica]
MTAQIQEIPPIPQAAPLEPPVPPKSSNLLPVTFQNDPAPPELIAQGAEALLYRTTYLLPSIPCALKYRPSKPYRHPILDTRLTKHRILSEARVLVKCRKEGVPVPAVYALDEKAGWLMFEWIEGEVVRVRLNEWLRRRKGVEGGIQLGEEYLRALMRRIGSALGRMHGIGIVHGDLTTSNMMLRPSKNEAVSAAGGSETEDQILDGDIVLIDFGLASQGTQDEDRAVDLYVLERAFASTHPRAEPLFSEVLDAYGKSFKGAHIVLKKLEDVRMRGRKRSMLG